MAGTWLSSISWLRTSENTLPDKASLFRNLVCGNFFRIGNMTPLSKPGLSWKITTLTEPCTLLPEDIEGLRAGEKLYSSAKKCFDRTMYRWPALQRHWLLKMHKVGQEVSSHRSPSLMSCADTALNRWNFSQKWTRFGENSRMITAFRMTTFHQGEINSAVTKMSQPWGFFNHNHHNLLFFPLWHIWCCCFRKLDIWADSAVVEGE